MEWEFKEIAPNYYVILRELTDADTYMQKINNTLKKKNNIKQVFPNGNDRYVIFDYKTGNYL